MEASAGQLRADIVDLTDLPLVDALVKQDILAPHKVPNFDSIDDVLKDPDGRWYTMVRLIYILGVNSAVIDPNTVKSWHDLTKPELKGSVGLPSIEAGGSAFSAYTFLRKQIGPEFLDALAANAPRIYPSVAPAMNDLARGEVSIGMITATTMQPQIALGAPVVPIYPEEGIPGFPISGGLTRAAIHPNAAKVYLNWITSLPGSNAVAATGGYGLSLGAARPVLGDLRLPEVDSLWNISLSDWVELRDKYIADWHKTFGAD